MNAWRNWKLFCHTLVCLWLWTPLKADAAGHPKIDPANGWKSLFNGKDLTGWVTSGSDGTPAPSDTWAVEDGTLTRKGRAYIHTEDKFRDFILDVEFKVGPETNSGILLRHTPDPVLKRQKKRYWWNGLLEVQILDCFGKSRPDKHDCAALYDMAAPTTNAMKPAGAWNRITITAEGSRITEFLNGEKVIDIDLDNWSELGKNPDGTPNKYHRPMKELADKDGYIWLQEHPGEIWFRNISIKPLD